MELYVLYNFRIVGLFGVTVIHLSHKLTECLTTYQAIEPKLQAE